MSVVSILTRAAAIVKASVDGETIWFQIHSHGPFHRGAP